MPQTPPETARQIRSILRAAFPSTRFVVRCSRGTGYGWIECQWVDGPTQDAVQEATAPARQHLWASCGLNLSRRYSAAGEAWAEQAVLGSQRWTVETDGEVNRHYFATRRALASTDLTGQAGP